MAMATMVNKQFMPEIIVAILIDYHFQSWSIISGNSIQLIQIKLLPRSVCMNAIRGQSTLFMIDAFIAAPAASIGTPKHDINSSQMIRFVNMIFCLVFLA